MKEDKLNKLTTVRPTDIANYTQRLLHSLTF